MGYKWFRIKNGITCFAIVELDVKAAANQNTIIEQYNGNGFTSQGYLEDVPDKGYDLWKTGAKRGLEYAFSIIDNYWTVYIKRIAGRTMIDTNPTIVAYTVMRAFFEKINYKLSDSLIDELELFVFDSWNTNNPDKAIPDFFVYSFDKK